MAASAYAALVSLMNTMDQIQIHPHLSTCFDNCQFESIRKMVDFLVDFVENCSEAEDLVRRIAVAAHEAEDAIEVEAADRIHAASTRKSLTMLLRLQRIVEEMSSIKVEVETGLITRQPTYSMPPPPPSSSSSSSSSSSVPLATTKTTMVGFDSYCSQLNDELTGLHSSRRIHPIVGMGGIGKTTLARNVYENSIMVHHFDVRAWVSVSQEFSVREIFLQALCCLGGSKSRKDKSDDEVGEELYKILYGRRYLIVLDDVWSVEAWEKIQFFFPENCNRSRIVVTTRQQQLVDYFASSSLALDFLDDKNSWELFCDKAFARECCPTELEEIGKKIVKKCKGLPLAISVIGGLLGKSPKMHQYWEKIAKDKSLVVEYSGEGNKALSILYLSYKHLPVCLKSCFLYLRLFPEDYEIDVSQLIKLWVAQGFIKANTFQSLEQVAESYIKDLADRNLLLVGVNKKFKTFFVHDLVRELCIRMAEKENVYCVQRDIEGRRQYIVDERIARSYSPESVTSERPSLMNPLIFDGQREAPFKSRLLRVLIREQNDLKYTFRQVNLRFLYSSYGYKTGLKKELPSSISLLWSMQTLIVEGTLQVVDAPSEIWKMPQRNK